MSALDNILATPLFPSGRPGDWLWWMEERAFSQYSARSLQRRADFTPSSAQSLADKRGAIAVIRVHGVMVPRAEWEDETSTAAIAEATRLAAADESIDGVVYDIDSPGGSSSGIAELADAIDELVAKKPVAMQCRGLMCSAAYYMASRGTKIYAQRKDLVGSIGTRMLIYDFSGYLESLHIKAIPIDTGPLKSTAAFGTPLTDEQRTYLQGIVNDFQQEFDAAVKKGRKYNDEQLAAVRTGAVFPASEALRLGLIDGIQTIDNTLAAMPRRQNTPSPQRSKPMSEATATQEETAATLQQLKKELPDASAEFYMQQIENGATLTEAIRAYATQVREQLAAERTAREAAEKKAAEAEAKAGKAAQQNTKQVRGNKLAAREAAGEGEQAVDYWQMAKDYQREHKCRWSEACLEIKHRHPESRDVFGAPPRKE